jgi:ABC-type microcin C transport system duplicated ATPase subunit YejF
MVMQNGDVVEQGPAQALFANPKQDYTKALLLAAFGPNS